MAIGAALVGCSKKPASVENPPTGSMKVEDIKVETSEASVPTK
jgi:hypothetical protein